MLQGVKNYSILHYTRTYVAVAVLFKVMYSAILLVFDIRNFKIFKVKFYCFLSCTNAKKWEIELATLKSNNIRLTSALQESTANVDEWKRQLHTYKEENLRLKLAMDAMKPAGNTTGTNSTENNDEMRREIIFLKNRVQVLEKDLMNADIELKASNKSLKEKSNDQIVRYVRL